MKILNYLKKLDHAYLIIVFILIYMGSNTLFTQIYISTQISAYLVFFIALGLYAVNGKFIIRLKRDYLICIFLLIGSILITLLINWDANNFNGYMLIMMKVIGAILILKCLELNRFLKAFSDVMFFLAIASLIITYIFPMFSLENMLPKVTNSMGISFYNGFFSFKINSYGTFGIRNYGIFSEPAVYCFFIFLGAITTLIQGKISKAFCLKMCTFIVTAMTTFSPIGFITAFVFYIILTGKIVKASTDWIIKTVPVVMAVVIVVLFLMNNDMSSGLEFVSYKATILSGNGAGRVACIIENFKQWLNNPIFGGGLAATTEIAMRIGYNTSTTGMMLAGFGLFFASMVTYSQFKSVFVLCRHEHIVTIITLFSLLVIQINNHGFIQGDWYWLFSMIGVVITKNETLNNSL